MCGQDDDIIISIESPMVLLTSSMTDYVLKHIKSLGVVVFQLITTLSD